MCEWQIGLIVALNYTKSYKLSWKDGWERWFDQQDENSEINGHNKLIINSCLIYQNLWYKFDMNDCIEKNIPWINVLPPIIFSAKPYN